ncbi:MAG TPA: YcxB family protein [Pyrinomonadaceae bacterium]|nr:YcxB family protein [Pyrinomonadaceae bacterium]
MEVTYKIHPDDYQAYVRHANLNSRTMRSSFRTLRFAPPVLFAALALPMMAVMNVGLVFGVVCVVTFAVLWVWNYPRHHQKMLDANAKKLLGEGRNAGLFCEHRMSIAEEGLSVASEYARAQVSWAMVERVEETKEHIFIYVGSMTAYLIPKWAFDSRRAAEDFFHTAQSFQRRAA